MTTLGLYLAIENHLNTWQSITAKSPAVQVATQYFEDYIASVTSAQTLTNNPRLFNYALSAFGLSNETYAKGLFEKVLQEGVTSSNALANTLNSPNILAFAKAFDFADNGAATTLSSSLVMNVVNRYIENSLETTEGQQDPGVQLALYFKDNAPNITSTYSILADKNLLTFVQTALGISPLTGLEPIDTQAAQLTTELNISDFQNPTKLNNFIERFAAAYDSNNNGSTSSASTSTGSTGALSMASLFQTESVSLSGIIAISPTTLLSAANTQSILL